MTYHRGTSMTSTLVSSLISPLIRSAHQTCSGSEICLVELLTVYRSDMSSMDSCDTAILCLLGLACDALWSDSTNSLLPCDSRKTRRASHLAGRGNNPKARSSATNYEVCFSSGHFILPSPAMLNSRRTLCSQTARLLDSL